MCVLQVQVKRYEEAHGSNKSTYWVIFELIWRDFFRYRWATPVPNLRCAPRFMQAGIALPFHLPCKHLTSSAHAAPSMSPDHACVQHYGNRWHCRCACRYFTVKHGDRIFYKGGVVGKRVQWQSDERLFERWRDGRTGMPLVDANMREMALTGFMSNRGRQNVASYLALDLGLDWRKVRGCCPQSKLRLATMHTCMGHARPGLAQGARLVCW